MSHLSVVNVDVDEKTLVQRDNSQAGLSGLIRAIAFLPVDLFFTALSNVLLLLQTITPKIIPLVVCFVFIPLLLFASLSAGWIVWRNVAVSWEATLYLQYGDGIPPYAEVALSKVVAQQPYDISLHLVVPATESNFALGNFMTTLKLTTASNRSLATIRRPAIALPPRPGRWSNRPDVIEFDVPLLDSYAAETSNLLAKIEIGRQDGWKSIGNGEGREISVLSSSLRGVIRHYGLRGLVTRFPLLAAIVSAFTFFGISFITLAACVLPTMVRRPRIESLLRVSPVKSEEENHALLKTNGDNSKLEHELQWKRSKLKRSRSRSEDRPPITTREGLPAIPMPSADVKRTPRRRRRSRDFDTEM